MNKVLSGESVEVTQHGRPVAIIKRGLRWMSGAEFAERLARIKPDPEAAAAVAKEVESFRKDTGARATGHLGVD